MAIMTTLAQLEEVQAAISAVMSGQAYQISGRQVTRADLKALSDRETLLLIRYKSEQGKGGPTFNRGIMERR
jgi:hypothetical protein